MAANNGFIALQRLNAVQRELGGELCRALELLTSKISYEFLVPAVREQASPRAYAEFREAKSLLSYLKYADPTTPVRTDEMTWALALVRESYRADGQAECAVLLEQATRILGVDLQRPPRIPPDLDRKIRNELRLKGSDEADAEAPLATAIA